MTRPIDLNDLRLLAQVIEHGNFTAASRAIGVPKSTISERIASLERAVGTGLLRRTSRSFSLTEAGEQLLPQARAIELLARGVERFVRDDRGELQQTLRVSCSIVIGQFAVAPILPQFIAEHPQASIRLEATNRMVDLVAEGFDMIVRGHAGPLKDSSLVQRVVGRTRWSLVASPAWAARHRPETPDDIDPRALLAFPGAPSFPNLVLRREEEERQIVLVGSSFWADDMIALRATAIAGGGIAHLPNYILRPYLESKELLTVLPDWTLPSAMISVLTPPKAQSSRLAQEFSDYLSTQLPPIVS